VVIATACAAVQLTASLFSAALLASAMGNTVTVNGPRPRLRAAEIQRIAKNAACWLDMKASRQDVIAIVTGEIVDF
jgi:hypothetical protein